MQAYAVNVGRKGITPIRRHSRLDELIESLGFLPWRPGAPPEDQDEDNGLSQWEYAGNHSLGADPLKHFIEGRIMSEIRHDVDVTALQVRIKGN
jgi:hypothetical protein